MKLTLRQLQLFVALVETESLTQAAERVCISQPAASLALAALERQLSRHLFDRVGKRLVLNENGVQFYPKASVVIEEALRAENVFQKTKTDMQGVIRVGMSMTIGDYIAPAQLARFMQQYPRIKIIQTIANSETIVHALEKFQLDVGFIEADCVSDILQVASWGDDELVVFSSPDHPLAKKEKITTADLLEADWIMRERGSGTRAILEKYLQPINIRMEVGSTTALKQMVACSQMIGCISEAALQQEFQQKQCIKLNINNLVLKRKLFRLQHRDKYCSEILRFFMQALVLPIPA